MIGVMSDHELLQRLELYLDAVPRQAARVEAFGALTLFTKIGSGWSYYARPSVDAGVVTLDDVEAVRQRQRQLNQPESLEWVHEVNPTLRPVAELSGMTVQVLPLMVHRRRTLFPVEPTGVRLRVLDPDDDALAAANAVAVVGFGCPGTAGGPAGAPERDAAAADMTIERLEVLRDRLRQHLTVTAVAASDELGPLCVGSHQPVGDVTEVVGVATLPTARRRGLAAAVTALLVADAHERGVGTIFLSAGSADVARLYARLGFERIGTACIAGPG